MNKIRKYLEEVLGVKVQVQKVAEQKLGRLPLFIREMYHFFETSLFEMEILLAEYKDDDNFTVGQVEKQLTIINKALNKKVVLLMPEITSFNRKRLIDKGINFIVPGRQLFLPDIFIDLRENFTPVRSRRRREMLQPSAQLILLYHLLHKNDPLDQAMLKELAQKFSYTQTAITKAINDLEYHELIRLHGSKSKFIEFKLDRRGLWEKLIEDEIYVNPVLKRVYTDDFPDELKLLRSNVSALAEYTDLNPGRIHFFALDKVKFYSLRKENRLNDLNENDGSICLEIWKYDPLKLAKGDSNDNLVVDPLSLYLSLKESKDERIEMELEKLLNGYVWS